MLNCFNFVFFLLKVVQKEISGTGIKKKSKSASKKCSKDCIFWTIVYI